MSGNKEQKDLAALEPVLEKAPSKALLSKLYARHAVQIFTTTNMVLSTVLFARMAKAVVAPSFLSFVLGWPASEMSHLMLFLQVSNMYWTFRTNPSLLHSLWGQAALLVNLWTSSVFARAVASQFLARPEFARAMLQQGKIEQKSGSSKALQLLTFLPLLTVARRFKTVRVQRDLHYSSLQITDPLLHERIMRTPQTIKMLNKLSLRGTHTRWNALDVVTTDPPPPPGAPVLVYIHGGGWFLGDKLFAGYSVIQRIASRGVVVFTINYRMSPETAFPGQIVDAKRALLWVKRNCHTYNGNARKIFVTGESAGGHLTALMATTPNFGPFQPPEDPAADTSVQGAIPLCGVFDWSDRNGHLEDLHVPLLEGARSTFRPYMERVVMQSTFKLNEDAFDNASPTFHVREMARRDSAPDLCPLMVVHGTLDALASLEDARAFFEAVRKVREKFGSWAPGEGDIFVENKDAHHAVGYFPSVRAMALGDAVVDFVTHHAGRLG